MLNKTFRLTKPRDFSIAKRYGFKLHGEYATVLVVSTKDPESQPKIAVVAPNKIAPNVPKRNRIKRLFRESIRANLDIIPKGISLIFYCNGKGLDKTYEEINTEVTTLIQKIRSTGSSAS